MAGPARQYVKLMSGPDNYNGGPLAADDGTQVGTEDGAVVPDAAQRAAADEGTVLNDLLRKPGSFAFSQATAIAAQHLRAHGPSPLNEESGENTASGLHHSMGIYGGHENAEVPPALRYSVNPNLSFPPGDIAAVNFKENEAGQPVEAEFVLNLMGLHGAGSPLPAYFTEHVAQHQDESDALRDFFDIFNHRLIDLLHGSWNKYRYHVQYRDHAADEMSSRFFSFIGIGPSALRQGKKLNWARLLPYMGLIAFSGEAAGSMESIMRHYFGHEAVSVVPCIRRQVAIPKEQLCALGLGNSTLSVDCLVGEEVADQTGKFRILIAALSWERFNAFLPGSAIFNELQSLVQFVLRSRLHFDVELHLQPEEIPPLHIGDGACRLGWSTWLGDNGDGIVLLEPGSEIAGGLTGEPTGSVNNFF